MDDLSARLRAKSWAGPPSYNDTLINPDGPEAADEIGRLRRLLQSIELATATGDGLSPHEAINVHALASKHSESMEGLV